MAQVYTDLNAEQLLEHALQRKEGTLSINGAFQVTTGKRTGRSPKDRFIVRDATTEKTVDWGVINQPCARKQFETLWKRAQDYIASHGHFINHLQVGADPQFGVPVTVITERAWHSLFIRQLLIREVKSKNAAWTMLNVPGLKLDPTKDGSNSDAILILDFTHRRILLMGLEYAGEMKKSAFSVLNYLLPEKNVFPMHCSANANEKGENVALMFGLSGTGKTTLSADPTRCLIGDDEHGWSENGVFNLEGGCYAKCIDLSQEREPMIWNAIRRGAVMENVVLDAKGYPDYADDSLTQNTRAAYPLEHIEKRVIENRGGQPHAVIFLSCDLFGVLPPVARLSKEQAAYYFLSGYTALMGSTEVGHTEAIKLTFSTCFGAPFFSRPPQVYADLLMKRIEHSGCEVYLVNTGWTGGAYGEGGHRFSIPTTRAIVSAITEGKLRHAEFTQFPFFNFAVPKALPSIDKNILDPRLNWKEPSHYDRYAQQLIEKFNVNFKRFKTSSAVAAAAPVAVT